MLIAAKRQEAAGKMWVTAAGKAGKTGVIVPPSFDVEWQGVMEELTKDIADIKAPIVAVNRNISRSGRTIIPSQRKRNEDVNEDVPIVPSTRRNQPGPRKGN